MNNTLDLENTDLHNLTSNNPAEMPLDPNLSTINGRIEGLFEDPPHHPEYPAYRQASFSVDAHAPLPNNAQHSLGDTLTRLQTLLPQPTDPTGPVESPIVSINEFEHAIVLTSSRFFQDLADVLVSAVQFLDLQEMHIN